MKQYVKGILTGVITTLLVGGLIITAFAVRFDQPATLYYNDIGVILDGELLELRDVLGRKVEPFLLDGTTYLPVRAIGEALDMEVSWNASTSTVILDSYSAQLKTVTVSTAKEFIDAIAPNTEIILSPGVYNISDCEGYAPSKYVRWDKYLYEGSPLCITGVKNLTIRGSGDDTQLVSSFRDYDAISFSNCQNLTVESLLVQHIPGEGGLGNTIRVDFSKNVIFKDVTIHGSHTGLFLYVVRQMTVTGLDVYDCDGVGVLVDDGAYIEFSDCTFRDMTAAGALAISKTDFLTVSDCLFSSVIVPSSASTERPLIYLADHYAISFLRNEFINNRAEALLPAQPGDVTFTDCTFKGNNFPAP